MPRVRIMDPGGMCFEITTRDLERILPAWFDEVLPWTHWQGRHDDPPIIWPKINVYPMWAWKIGTPSDPDWLCDTRVIGHLYDFPAKDGTTGMRELLALRRRLEAELDAYNSGT